MDLKVAEGVIEAVLFASGDPVTTEELVNITGLENAGHPHPESNLSSEEKRISPSTTSTYIPSSKKSSYFPLNAGSVIESCVISYSSLVK